MTNENTANFETAIRPVVRIKPPDTKFIYSNSVAILATQWDFQFIFGQVREGEPGQFVAEDQVTIVMTPEHALALFKAIEQNIRRFKEASGSEIREVRPVSPPPQGSE